MREGDRDVETASPGSPAAPRPSADHPAGSASIIIPAHNEASLIAASLSALSQAAGTGGLDLQVIVVPNGCSDNTAEIAGRHPGVLVVELQTSGKHAALNAGDAAAQHFPRIYLDADVHLDAVALAELIRVLDTDRAVAASPRIHFETRGSSWGVRAFYRIFERLPYANDQLVGLGVYGLSRAGRDRFERFPQLQADDLFIQRLFNPTERLVVPGRCTVSVPRDLINLVKVRTRVARGNRELSESATDDARFATTSGSTLKALVDLIRSDVRLAPAAAVYVLVGVAARLRARRGPVTWDRDDSTR